eukprot:gene3378-3858_t
MKSQLRDALAVKLPAEVTKRIRTARDAPAAKALANVEKRAAKAARAASRGRRHTSGAAKIPHPDHAWFARTLDAIVVELNSELLTDGRFAGLNRVQRAW